MLPEKITDIGTYRLIVFFEITLILLKVRACKVQVIDSACNIHREEDVIFRKDCLNKLVINVVLDAFDK